MRHLGHTMEWAVSGGRPMSSLLGLAMVVLTALPPAPLTAGEDVGGLRLELRARSDTICAYEPLALCVKLTNVSTRPVCIPYGEIGPEYTNIRLGYGADEGSFTDYWSANEHEGGVTTSWLLPGASAFSDAYVLFNDATHEYAFPAPGTYRVSAAYRSEYTAGVDCRASEIPVTVRMATYDELEALPFYVGVLRAHFLAEDQPWPEAVESMQELVRNHVDCRYAPYALAALARHWTRYLAEDAPGHWDWTSDYPRAKAAYQRVIDHPRAPAYLRDQARREIARITAVQQQKPVPGTAQELHMELAGEGADTHLLLTARFGPRDGVSENDCQLNMGELRMDVQGERRGTVTKAHLPPPQDRVELADGAHELRRTVTLEDLHVVAGDRRIENLGWVWNGKSAGISDLQAALERASDPPEQ